MSNTSTASQDDLQSSQTISNQNKLEPSLKLNYVFCDGHLLQGAAQRQQVEAKRERIWICAATRNTCWEKKGTSILRNIVASIRHRCSLQWDWKWKLEIRCLHEKTRSVCPIGFADVWSIFVSICIYIERESQRYIDISININININIYI